MATPTLIVGTNTYQTLLEATDRIDSRLFGDNFSGASTDDKNKALLQSRTILDTFFDWKGTPVSYDLAVQPLDWPRYNVYDRDGRSISHESVPELILKAHAEFANYLLGEDISEVSAGEGELTSAKAGPLQVTFNNRDGSSSTGMIPDYFVALLSDYGSPSDAAGGDEGGVVSLRRS